MMPFYSNGSRMSIVSGVTYMMNGKGSITVPFQIPESGNSLTDVIDKTKPMNSNNLTVIPEGLSKLFKVDIYTGIFLFCCLIFAIYYAIISIIEVNYSHGEQELYKNAFDSSISNTELKNSFGPIFKNANISSIPIAFLTAFSFPNILINLSGEGFKLFLSPLPILFLTGVILFKAFIFWQEAKGFLNNLIRRRCEECFEMDTYKIIDKVFVRTDTTTTNHYKTTTYNNGQKSTQHTGSSTVKHDVHDYTYECQNCKFTFKVRY